MKTPIDIIMDSVGWKAVETATADDHCNGLPHVTHEGILNIFDASIRCYILSDGNRILNTEDVDNLFSEKPNDHDGATTQDLAMELGATPEEAKAIETRIERIAGNNLKSTPKAEGKNEN